MELKKLFSDYLYPVAVFSGGMIGVGFLSLPYIALKSGIWLTLGYFVLLTSMMVAINLIFCDISLKTPDFKRFPGFVEHYFGKGWGMLTMFLMILGSFGVLLIYLLVGGEFMASLFQPIFHGSQTFYTVIYFIIVSLIIYFDINLVAKVEFWVIALLLASCLMIFAGGLEKINLDNILNLGGGFGLSNLLLPYGPVLFALWGIGMIPEIEEMLMKKKHNLKKISVISTVAVSSFYMLFVLLILAISGKGTGQTALPELKNFLNPAIVYVSIFIGVLATLTAFITQGIIFKKVLMFDLKIKHYQAFIITCFTPMVLFLLGLKSFVPLISFIGAVLLGIDGILIMMMYRKIPAWKKAGPALKIFAWAMTAVFVAGIIYEIIPFII